MLQWRRILQMTKCLYVAHVAPHPRSVLRPVAFSTFSFSILHVDAMIRPLVAIGALVVLAVVTEAASTKYEDDYKGDSCGKSASSTGRLLQE